MADIPARTELEGHHRPDPRQPQDPCRPAQRGDARDRSRARAPASRRCASTIARGPYTDPDARIDIMAGLPELRARLDPRPRRRRGGRSSARSAPRITASSAPTAAAASSPSPTSAARCSAPSPARTSARCTMPAAASSPPRWNMSPIRENLGRERIADARPRRRGFRRLDPRLRHPRIRPRRGRPRPRDHPQQHQPPRIRADGDRPQLPGQDQRQYRQLRGRLRRRRRSRQDGLVDPLGRRHRHGPLHRPQHPRHPRMDHPQLRPSRSAPSPSTRRWRRSAASPRT